MFCGIETLFISGPIVSRADSNPGLFAWVTNCAVYVRESCINQHLLDTVARLNIWKYVLTHWGWVTMAVISQTFLISLSLNENFCSLIQFSLEIESLAAILITDKYWFRKWLGIEQATNHHLNQRYPSLLTHIYVTLPQWIDVQSHDIPMYLDLFKGCAIAVKFEVLFLRSCHKTIKITIRNSVSWT